MKDKDSNKNTAVRIKDIAEKAGVSTGTVDRVLHNRGRVSEQVKEKVLRIAKELNYEPNMLARALVSKREYKIAALIPDSTLDGYWGGPQEGIEKAGHDLKQYGVTITQHIFNQFNVDTFRKEAEKVSELAYDGILTAPVFYRESLTFLNRWKREGIPFNLFNTHIPDYEPLAYIGQDSYQSGLLAAKMLHYGVQKPTSFVVAHIDEDVPNSSHLIKKEQGFQDYFDQYTSNEFHIIHEELTHGNDQVFFAKQMDKIITKNPEISGFFVTTSKAYTIASYLKSKNLKKIRLVGYDLLKKNLDFLDEGYIDFLINQNPIGQGYYGIQLLIDHLIFKKEIPPIKYLPLDIITRENLHYYINSGI